MRLCGAIGLSVLVGFIGFGAYFYFDFQEKTSNGIPLPGYPITFPIGSLEAFGDPNFINGLELLTKKYADVKTGLSSIWKLSTQIVSVTHHEDVKALLSTTSSNVNPPNVLKVLQFILGKTALVALTGEEWVKYRQHLQNSVDSVEMNTLLPELDEFVQLLAKSFNEGNKEFDAVPEIQKMVFRIVGKAAYNHPFEDEDKEALSLMNREVIRRIQSINPADSELWVPTSSNKELSVARERIRKSIGSEIESRRKNGNTHEDFLKHFLNTPLSDEEIIDGICATIFGSVQVLTSFFTYSVFILGSRQDIQTKVAEEAIQILGSQEALTIEKIDQLSYTKLVVNEVLRLYPPAPLTQRTLDHTIEVGSSPNKHKLPIGMDVWVPVWVIHRSPLNFKDPETFNPDRFKDHISQYSHIPFSAGPRNCPGQTFALQLAAGAVARIAMLTKIQSVKDHVIPVGNGLTQLPENGLNITSSTRNV